MWPASRVTLRFIVQSLTADVITLAQLPHTPDDDAGRCCRRERRWVATPLQPNCPHHVALHCQISRPSRTDLRRESLSTDRKGSMLGTNLSHCSQSDRQLIPVEAPAEARVCCQLADHRSLPSCRIPFPLAAHLGKHEHVGQKILGMLNCFATRQKTF